MGMSYKEWEVCVVQHYGALDNFNDASTVRLMLAKQRAKIAELETLRLELAKIPQRGLAQELTFDLVEDLEFTAASVNVLESWLERRKLTY